MEAARPINRDAAIPVVQPFSELASPRPGDPSETAWRSNMEAENARKVALMTPDQREAELRQLSSKFGDIAELASILRRAKDSKSTAYKGTTSATVEEISDEDSPRIPPLQAPSPPPVRNPQHRVATPPRPVLSRRSSVSGVSRPGANTPGVRFAEVTSRDVFTYPSAPTSPKRTMLMIEAPPAEGSGDNVTKVQWKGKIPPTAEFTDAVQPDPQSGLASGAIAEDEIKKQESAHPLSQVISSSPSATPNLSDQAPKSEADTSAPPTLKPIDTFATPEAIRQQYFPNEPQRNPNIEWMADLPEIPDTPTTSEYAYIDGMNMNEKTRFNLAGTPIPHDIAKEMPSHDGLHHNSRSTAGESESTWVWACKAGVGAVCVGVAAAVSLKAAL
ncbi:hypothetical protein RSOLAG22IIIB_06476 [Rhizoctonia solani]|uniref:Uncharacterized protein n=1 Tax=Rhizoctonia solani TaxID=456999 RepID=A0A0K6GEK3_9AGAM|nr:hypothetical protein RSOLAG22IIIB_06476 [Rhizoctonia solani]